MKRRLLDRLYAALEWLLLLLDGHMPTQVRIKAVKPVPFVVPVQQAPRLGISKARAAMYHQCIPPGDVIPWEGGSWYCPKCRQVRTYIPLSLPRPEATAPGDGTECNYPHPLPCYCVLVACPALCGLQVIATCIQWLK